MADNRRRERQNEHWLNEYELQALEPVLVRLGATLGDFTKRELRNLLQIAYNLQHKDRHDPSKTVAAIEIAAQGLGTVRRYEIDKHVGDASFRLDAAQACAQVRKELDDIEAHLQRGGA